MTLLFRENVAGGEAGGAGGTAAARQDGDGREGRGWKPHPRKRGGNMNFERTSNNQRRIER